MFNLETAIQEWKRSLRKNAGYEDGDIEELESHLLEEISTSVSEGVSQQYAFEKAISNIGGFEELGRELLKNKTSPTFAIHERVRNSNILALLPHFLKSVSRSAIRNKTYSLVNLLGLTLGITSFIIILTWIVFQISFDRSHSKASQIYRIANTIQDNSETTHFAVSSPMIAPFLAENLEGITDYVRIDWNDALIESENYQFNEDYVLFTDPGFFSVFDFQLIRGNPETALRNPFSIVITEEIARKYFGEQNPIGESLRVYQYDPDGNGVEYQVTGVIENPPANSHIQFNVLASFASIETTFADVLEERGWIINQFYSYVLTSETSSIVDLQSDLAELEIPFLERLQEEDQTYYSFTLQPLKEIYLHSSLEDEVSIRGSLVNVMILSSIAFFLIAIAGINYVNLATALSMEKIKGVVVRKVVGASRKELFTLIASEAMFFVFVAYVLSLFLIIAFKSFFSSLIGSEVFETSVLIASVLSLGFVFILGTITSIFPAFLTLSINIIKGLRGKVLSSIKDSRLKKGLVVVQFSLSVALIVSVLTISDQLSFIKAKSLGYDQSSLLALKVNGSNEVGEGYDVFETDLLNLNGIENVSRSNSLLFNGLDEEDAIYISETGEEIEVELQELAVDYNFLETHGIELLAGRNLSIEFASDSNNAVLLSKAAIDRFGWDNPEDALGNIIDFMGDERTVIGVFGDFHTNSMFHEIDPLGMYLNQNLPSRITVNADLANSVSTLTSIEETWRTHFPNTLFDYTFVEAAVQSQYSDEIRFARLFRIFSALSLVISCIGLFGITSFSIRKRTKEIGIRKVLGASSARIVRLVSAEFLILLVVANVISWPFIIIAMQKWLSLFVYKIPFPIVNLAITLITTIVIAFLAIGYHAVIASKVDPVHQLRSE